MLFMEEKQQIQSIFNQIKRSFIRRWGIELTLADQVRLKSEYIPRVLEDLKEIKDPNWGFEPDVEAESRFLSENYGIYPDPEMFCKNRPWRDRVVKYAQLNYDRFHLV